MALEMMSSGVACAISDTGAEFAKAGENCLTFPVGDTEAIHDAVEALILDRDRLTSIAENGYATAKEMGDSTQYRKNLDRMVKDLCGE
jgi:glycosyltransferase involved in cell wall biosynthesis